MWKCTLLDQLAGINFSINNTGRLTWEIWHQDYRGKNVLGGASLDVGMEYIAAHGTLLDAELDDVLSVDIRWEVVKEEVFPVLSKVDNKECRLEAALAVFEEICSKASRCEFLPSDGETDAWKEFRRC